MAEHNDSTVSNAATSSELALGESTDKMISGLTLADIEIVETTNKTSQVSESENETQATEPSPFRPTAANSTPTIATTNLSIDVPPHYVAHPNSLPYTFIQSYTIGGVPTDVCMQIFQDQVVLACSQLQGRIANWVFFQPPAADVVLRNSSTVSADMQVTMLLGDREQESMLMVYGKRIWEQTSMAVSNKSLLFGMALQDLRDPAVFHTITNLLVQIWQEQRDI